MKTKRLATEQGKEFALKALAERRAESAKTEPINNASLYAGSPMYFYCRTCGAIADVLPEAYISEPKDYCDECKALIDLEWMI